MIETPMREIGNEENEITLPLPQPEKREAAKDDRRGVLLGGLSDLFGNIGEDDILLAALIIILAGEGNEGNREAILLLILLLCIR